MIYGKTIELFLVNGTADSLIIAELSNWNGKAIKIPRIEVSSCDREDITLVIVRILRRQGYTSCFVRKMMVLILYTLVKQKILKKDLYSI